MRILLPVYDSTRPTDTADEIEINDTMIDDGDVQIVLPATGASYVVHVDSLIESLQIISNQRKSEYDL